MSSAGHSPRNRDWTALGVLLVIASIWSCSTVAIKFALVAVTPGELLLLRHLPGAIVVGIFLALFRRKTTARVIKLDGVRVVVMGLLAVVGIQACLIWGLTRIPAALSGVIPAANPAMTYVMAGLFLHEPLSRWRTAGLICAAAGLYICIGMGTGMVIEGGYLVGALVTVIGQMMAGVYNVVGRSVMTRHRAVEVIGLTLVAGVLPTLFYLTPTLLGHLQSAPPSAIIAILFLTLINTTPTMILFAWSLGRVGATRASSFVFLVPLGSLVWASLLLGEAITPWLAGGAGVLIVGVWTIQRNRPPWYFLFSRNSTTQ